MLEIVIFSSCTHFGRKRQQQLLGFILPFDGLTFSSGIRCSTHVPINKQTLPILQQLLHTSFGRLQILACLWPCLPIVCNKDILVKKVRVLV